MRRVRDVERARRRLGLGLILFSLLIVIGAVWVAVTGWFAKSDLEHVRSDVAALRADISSGSTGSFDALAKDAKKRAHRAHLLTSGPFWALAAHVPLSGDGFRSIRGIAEAGDSLGKSAIGPLLQAREALDPATLRKPDGSFDVARIAAVSPAISTANRAVALALETVSSLPRSTWLPVVDRARTSLIEQLRPLSLTLDDADRAGRLLPPLLGINGPKRYFVAFQNNAEARGTGGLPGAFAILTADHGKVVFDQFASDKALDNVKSGLDLGADFNSLYGQADSTSLYVNSNLSPHFPYAAQIWAAMWQKKTGQTIDGAVAVDPQALSYLLAVTGPTTLPDGTQIRADNVVSFTQSEVYAKIPNRDLRRVYLTAVASAIGDDVLNAKGSLKPMAKAAAQAARERRLLVWSRDPVVEGLLEQTPLSGSVPETTAAYVGLSLVNDGGDKLDYYLDRSLDWQRVGCVGTRLVTVTVKLTNNAPASGLVDDVTVRTDKHDYPVKPGDNRTAVFYYATQGATLASVTVDGKPATAQLGTDRGHPVFLVEVETPRGKSSTTVLHLTEPAGSGYPIVLNQPLVRPLNVTIEDSSCH